MSESICGRGADGVEWSVRVGSRVRSLLIGVDHSVVALDGAYIEVKSEVTQYGRWVYRACFFREFLPLDVKSSYPAKVSRWLDPASVPVGRPMPLCSCPVGPSPTFQCPYPAQVREAGNHRCAARLRPSVLTPVQRWRSLLGTHWSCGRPERVAFAARLDRTAARATWLVSYRGYPPTGRARKVADGSFAQTLHSAQARWRSIA